ncbi:K(lysine) acetyltransferase [Saitoella coloradoensis]
MDLAPRQLRWVKWREDSYSSASILNIDVDTRRAYVHYINQDKRLDAWVPFSAIGDVVDEGAASPASGAEDRVASPQAAMDAQSVSTEGPDQGVRNVDKVLFGRYEIHTWYRSPYPAELVRHGGVPYLHVCPLCFKYTTDGELLRKHVLACPKRHDLPGKKVYEKGHLSIYEVDGDVEKLYCQNLCLFAKLFLDHKTIYYDVSGFLFYVLVNNNQSGSSTPEYCAYFSKEKVSWDNNNLACIITFPPHQRHGYGRMLISFSYALSRLEDVRGGPERPLSDLGYRGYINYWTGTVAAVLLKTNEDEQTDTTIEEISEATGIREEEVLEAMTQMGLNNWAKKDGAVVVNANDIKSWIRENNIKTDSMIDEDCMIIEEG